MAALSHTNRHKDFLLYVGARVLPGEGAEVKELLPLVDRFVEGVGPGVMKTLLIDRGLIDGKSITRIKREHGVDVVVPSRPRWPSPRMPGNWPRWMARPGRSGGRRRRKPTAPADQPQVIREREKKRATLAKKKKAAAEPPPPHLVKVEFKVIPRIELWKECQVPLDVVLMREHLSNGRSPSGA
jgi:hypothetical protein